jgi:cwf21 domain
MYNGVGLSSVRGTATSGHVQTSRAALRPNHHRHRHHQPRGGHGEEDRRASRRSKDDGDDKDTNDPLASLLSGKRAREQLRAELSLHNQKREIENELMQFQLEMEDEGMDPDDIEHRVERQRAILYEPLLKQLEQKSKKKDNNDEGIETPQGNAEVEEAAAQGATGAAGIEALPEHPEGGPPAASTIVSPPAGDAQGRGKGRWGPKANSNSSNISNNSNRSSSYAAGTGPSTSSMRSPPDTNMKKVKPPSKADKMAFALGISSRERPLTKSCRRNGSGRRPRSGSSSGRRRPRSPPRWRPTWPSCSTSNW